MSRSASASRACWRRSTSSRGIARTSAAVYSAPLVSLASLSRAGQSVALAAIRPSASGSPVRPAIGLEASGSGPVLPGMELPAGRPSSSMFRFGFRSGELAPPPRARPGQGP